MTTRMAQPYSDNNRVFMSRPRNEFPTLISGDRLLYSRSVKSARACGEIQFRIGRCQRRKFDNGIPRPADYEIGIRNSGAPIRLIKSSESEPASPERSASSTQASAARRISALPP